MNADFTSDPIIIIIVVKKECSNTKVSTRVCPRGVVETCKFIVPNTRHDLVRQYILKLFY